MPFATVSSGDVGELGTRSMAGYAWELKQGQTLGQLKREGTGMYTLATTGVSRSIATPPVLTAVYPQAAQTMEVYQSALNMQLKTPQRLAVYVQVRSETGEVY